MENRSNHLLVGGVVLALLVALALALVWLARLSDKQTTPYDILFKQSVDGLSKGSSVSFSGVPVGQIKEIALLPQNPEFVRVRIVVDHNTPITVGTTAAIQGVGFTGVSQIQLDGAVKGAPPLDEPGPYGAPIIPTRQAGLGALLNNAPLLMERLSTLTEKLNDLMSDQNQKYVGSILGNVDRLTTTLANSSPDLARAINDAQTALRQAGQAADQLRAVAATTNDMLDKDGRPILADVQKTLASAEKSMNTLQKTLEDAQPGMQAMSKQTIPELNALIRDMQDTSESIRALTNRLDADGAGGLLRGRTLPDYDPKGK